MNDKTEYFQRNTKTGTKKSFVSCCSPVERTFYERSFVNACLNIFIDFSSVKKTRSPHGRDFVFDNIENYVRCSCPASTPQLPERISNRYHILKRFTHGRGAVVPLGFTKLTRERRFFRKVYTLRIATRVLTSYPFNIHAFNKLKTV